MNSNGNFGFMQPTENVRGFTELEKAMIREAMCLDFKVIETVVGIDSKLKIIVNSEISIFEETSNELQNIEFSHCSYVYEGAKKESDLYMIVEIIVIDEKLKNAVINYDVNKLTKT